MNKKILWLGVAIGVTGTFVVLNLDASAEVLDRVVTIKGSTAKVTNVTIFEQDSKLKIDVHGKAFDADGGTGEEASVTCEVPVGSSAEITLKAFMSNAALKCWRQSRGLEQ